MFDHQLAFNQFILANNVIGICEKPVRLKSGRETHWYVNWRSIVEDAYLTGVLADHIIRFTQSNDLHPDTFLGVREGASKIALITQDRWARLSENYSPGSHALCMGRGKPKTHGDKKDCGDYLGLPRGKTIIIEDVTTTGGSLLDEISRAKDAGANVIAAYALTDRGGVREDSLTIRDVVEKKGVSYFALSNALELLPRIYDPELHREELVHKIEQELAKSGVHFKFS